MRLDDKREAELDRRRGLATKTVIAVIWLAFCFAVAYFLTGWLAEEGYVTAEFFYTQLFIPRTIDQDIVRVGFMVFIVFVMQFLILIGFAFSSPAGRLRPGTPSAQAGDPDPSAKKYDYH